MAGDEGAQFVIGQTTGAPADRILHAELLHRCPKRDLVGARMERAQRVETHVRVGPTQLPHHLEEKIDPRSRDIEPTWINSASSPLAAPVSSDTGSACRGLSISRRG